MKKIEAVVKPFVLEKVVEALTNIGINGVTVSEVRGFGKQRGHSEIYRGSEYALEYVPKIWLTIVVSDEEADQVIQTIVQEARTGKIGDGKVFVSNLDMMVEIRTGRYVG